jgi:uncharacterized membrane protein YqjE
MHTESRSTRLEGDIRVEPTPTTGSHPMGMPELRDIPVMIRRLGSDLSTYADQKMALFKAEMREEVRGLLRGTGMMVAGGVLAVLGLSLINIALGFFLARIFPFSQTVNFGLGFLSLSLIYVVAGIVVLMIGKKRFNETPKVPEKTIEDFKRDKEWLQNEVM